MGARELRSDTPKSQEYYGWTIRNRSYLYSLSLSSRGRVFLASRTHQDAASSQFCHPA